MELKTEMPYFLEHIDAVIRGKLYLQNFRGDFSFDRLSPAYLRTNENMNAYYSKMDFNDKKVLSVIGSSDHVFEAISRGASSVDGFDISIPAIMFFYLKEAAMKVLSYEEYITFFFLERKSFDKHVYGRIEPYLNEIAREFWNKIFDIKEPKRIISSAYVTEPSYISSVYKDFRIIADTLARASSYFAEENFYLLKEKLKKARIDVYLSDVRELDKIGDLYDNIILSNIIEYQKNYDYVKFIRAVERYYNFKLNSGGAIMAGYLFRDPYPNESKEFEIETIENFLITIGEESLLKKHYALFKRRNF